jgi:hypothetical protein
MDSDGYPEDVEFAQLNLLDDLPEAEAFALIVKLFNGCGSGHARMGRGLDDWYPPKEVNVLELSTGGWSGCETMIEYMQKKCRIFWIQYWYSEVRGGHYVFKGR